VAWCDDYGEIGLVAEANHCGTIALEESVMCKTGDTQRLPSGVARKVKKGDNAYQRKGLGKWLTETILQTPSLQAVTKWSLTTTYAQGLYKKCGFSCLKNPEYVMELLKNHW
jgi:hypothetical protein